MTLTGTITQRQRRIIAFLKALPNVKIRNNDMLELTKKKAYIDETRSEFGTLATNITKTSNQYVIDLYRTPIDTNTNI